MSDHHEANDRAFLSAEAAYLREPAWRTGEDEPDDPAELLRYVARIAFAAGVDHGQREAETRLRRAVATALDAPASEADAAGFDAMERALNAPADVRREARALDVWGIIRGLRDEYRGTPATPKTETDR